MTQCQADQLAVAVRSPVASEHHKHRSSVQVVSERPRVTSLVCHREFDTCHRVPPSVLSSRRHPTIANTEAPIEKAV